MNSPVSGRSGIVFLLCMLSPGLQPATKDNPLQRENLDSLSGAFATAVTHLTTPALEQRDSLKRDFQQRGYAQALLELLAGDGCMALIVHARTRLQLEFSVSHEPLYYYARVGQGREPPVPIPLHENWAFPADPWERRR